MRRFTRELTALVIIIVLVGLGFLLAPTVRGILAERAHDADQATSCRTPSPSTRKRESSHNLNGQPWPVRSEFHGRALPTATNATAQTAARRAPGSPLNFSPNPPLSSPPDVITSAETTLNVGATNAPSGNYGWYIGTDGQVSLRARIHARCWLPVRQLDPEYAVWQQTSLNGIHDNSKDLQWYDADNCFFVIWPEKDGHHISLDVAQYI